MSAARRILVIKLGALGDVVQAFAPFAAIRTHHPRAQITLLTTRPFAALLARSPWFDAVWDDGRPDWSDLPAVARLARRLRGARFDRVYDLQTSPRSTRYRWAVGSGAEWSGVASGGSHPHANPARDAMHTADRQREQLAIAGITRWPVPELDWLDADVARFGLPTRYTLLIPGGSAHRPGKRWPIEGYARLAAGLACPAVVVGSATEAPLAAAIRGQAPVALDLTGRTDLPSLAALARRAAGAVGNDTGPTHLVAALGCPTVVLFGAESDPALCAPRGPAVTILRRCPIAAVGVEEVRRALP